MFQLNGGSSAHGRYPAGPGGMLMEGGSFGSRKASATWAKWSERANLLQVAVGILLALLSMRYLYQFTSFTGQFLGALLVVSGLVGVLGDRMRSVNVVNLQLILSIVGMLLAFQFIGEVVHDVQIDCALAELYHSGKATAKQVAAARQAEAMQAVFSRLNEMEDMLTLAQHSAVKQMELKQAQQELKFTDLNYITAKLEMVRKHAQEVLDSVLSNPNITATTIAEMSEETKELLRKRLDVADRVLERVKKHHSAEEEISYEEYTQILEALMHPEHVAEKAAHPELQQAKAELPNMRAAIDRQKSNAYHTLNVGETAQHLTNIEQYRQQRREEFNQQFERHLQQQQAANGGSDYLSELPEHCIKETTGEKVMVGLGIAMVVLQLASSYLALGLSLRLPVKAE